MNSIMDNNIKTIWGVDVFRFPDPKIRDYNRRQAGIVDIPIYEREEELQYLLKHYGEPILIGERTPNLRTNAGVDWLASQIGNSASAYMNYIGLSSDNGSPAVGDTTMVGELTTLGLGRALATYSHSTANANYGLTKGFTFTGSSSTTVYKVGLFTAISGGTLGYESLLATPATVTNNGEIINASATVTL